MLQIKALKQPILIEVIDYNTSGVIARVEVNFVAFLERVKIFAVEVTKGSAAFWMQGLRAFLPLKEFINRPKTLEDYVSGMTFL